MHLFQTVVTLFLVGWAFNVAGTSLSTHHARVVASDAVKWTGVALSWFGNAVQLGGALIYFFNIGSIYRRSERQEPLMASGRPVRRGNPRRR